MSAAEERVDRLLDAIDLVREDRRDEARLLLRDLVNEDSNFEEAWLWMSVTVDTLDQSSVCLDNVVRVNPNNAWAARALHRLRLPEMEMQKRRNRLRLYRDLALTTMWLLVVGLLYLMMFTYLS